jgi:type I restriction enzyme S subunit
MKQRIKEICDYVSRGSTPDYVDDSPYKVMNQATFSKGFLDESNMRFTSKPAKGAHIMKGDLLMASTGGGVLGKILYYDSDENSFFADSHVSILRNSKGKNHMKYLYYHFSNKYDEINSTMVKGSTNQTELQRDYLLSYELEIPSIDIQQRIVDYLDAKLSEIDNRVSVLEKQKDAYTRLKKSIIHQAVTRGLNPDVRLKDSGIKWIGMIPEHWKELHLKNCVNINNGKDYKEVEVEDGYPVIGSGGVFAYASDKMYEGEVLLLGRKGTIDKPLYYNGPFWSVDTMFYAIPKKNTCCRFIYYCATQFPFGKISTATALPSMTQKELYQLPVMLPPISEQQAIAAYLDEKCAKTDAAIENIGKQIEASKRLKRAIINEAISGKTVI